MLGAIAQRAEVRNHADVPEDDRDGCVGRNGEDVPGQRRAELRPDVHRVRVGQEPVREPWTADVDERKGAGADDGKDGHRLGEAVDRVAPGLLEQQKNGRDQRAGVADTDPPDEVDDGEAPGTGDGNTPDADALVEQPGKTDDQALRDEQAEEHTEEPADAACSPVSTNPAIFCVTDLKLWPGAMTAYSPVRGSIIGSIDVIGGGIRTRFGRHYASSSSGFGLMTPAV